MPITSPFNVTPQAAYGATGTVRVASSPLSSSNASSPGVTGSVSVGSFPLGGSPQEGRFATLPIGETTAQITQPTETDVLTAVVVTMAKQVIQTVLSTFGLGKGATSQGTTATAPSTASALPQLQQTLNPDNDPDVANIINLAGQDSEVARLMTDAANNNVTVRFGPTDPNTNGFFQPTGQGTGFIVISERLRNSPTLEGMSTLIHEMVHAATAEDGNSLFEEGVAEAFSETKAAELRNAFNIVPGRTFPPPNANQIINERMALYAQLEPDLRQNNDILNSLQNLGINFVA